MAKRILTAVITIMILIGPANAFTPGLPVKPAFAPAIPGRPNTGISGSEFMQMTKDISKSERQRAATKEILKGNIPSFLRRFKPVSLIVGNGTGPFSSATIWVMPDYLSIGESPDFVRIPLSFPSALKIAEKFKMMLPTRKIVDAIERQAEFHFTPQPLPAGPMMRSNDYYIQHQFMIEAQHAGRPLGELVCGHKKDLVLTNRLFEHPGRVAIYGWHWQNGCPIQPLSTIHIADYEDYSHGVRLIFPIAKIGDRYIRIDKALDDENLGPLFTYEGTIPRACGFFEG